MRLKPCGNCIHRIPAIGLVARTAGTQIPHGGSAEWDFSEGNVDGGSGSYWRPSVGIAPSDMDGIDGYDSGSDE